MPSTIRDLTELTAVAVDDYILISDTSDVVNRDKRISKANLVNQLTGTGTVATGSYTLTVPATGTASLLGTAQTFSALKTFSAGINLGDENLTVYDEGTWTPGLIIGATSTGIVYSFQVGTYTRIGRLVFYTLDLRLSSKGSNVGNLGVTGLPFAAAANNSYAWLKWTNFATAIGGLMLQSAASTQFSLSYLAAAGGTSVGLATDTLLTNTTIFQGVGMYYV